ncbi:unnamed protein product [Clonostachys chloroleuca]|uniref:AB hydrolase-1 domain-containing protein n=1 Tax=Clonostachys chloroleuca TaxID=1926264 RepID=A0AA35M6J8_9HYPO|nr:unnamed protein product [Clonostachys chloroleuca]
MIPHRLAATALLGTFAAASLQTKYLTTRDGSTYVYDYIPASGEPNNTTVLLLHGYPSSRHDWRHQVSDLSAAGYGVLAPDCLGYGDSDMPLEVEAYNLKRLGGHLMEILDNEDLQTVVGVGHDWGTNLLSRTYVWHHDRFEKLAFLSLGYSAPGVFADIDLLNAMSLSQLGYMQFGYFYFFNSYNGADLAASKLDSFFSLAFPTDNSKWAENLAGLGTARAWLEANTTRPLASYLTEQDKEAWMKVYSRKGAVQASMNYYKALLRGVQAKDESCLTDKHRTIKVPVLTIGGMQDTVTRADQIRAQTEPWAAAGYTEKTVDAGHWMMHEDREGVSSALLEFLRA